MNNIFSPFNNHLYKPYYLPKRPPYSQSKFFNHATEKKNKDTDFQDNSTNQNIHKKSGNQLEIKNIQREKPLLEFGGIQLYNDDLLILLLIYFLYKEKINDKLLLIALFSLLFWKTI